MLIAIHGVNFLLIDIYVVKLYAHCYTWSSFIWSEAICSLLHME